VLQVGYAVEKMSKRLEVNDQKTKVRRMDSLPEHDETGNFVYKPKKQYIQSYGLSKIPEIFKKYLVTSGKLIWQR
jgi:hypothetical protein